MLLTTDETPGRAPVATIHDRKGVQRAVWVGWDQDHEALESWVRSCHYVIESEPIARTEHTKTYPLFAR